MTLKFKGIGFETTLRKRRYSYLISLAKALILGHGLEINQKLSYFLVEYDKRPAVLLFLDGMGAPKNTPPGLRI